MKVEKYTTASIDELKKIIIDEHGKIDFMADRYFANVKRRNIGYRNALAYLKENEENDKFLDLFLNIIEALCDINLLYGFGYPGDDYISWLIDSYMEYLLDHLELLINHFSPTIIEAMLCIASKIGSKVSMEKQLERSDVFLKLYSIVKPISKEDEKYDMGLIRYNEIINNLNFELNVLSGNELYLEKTLKNIDNTWCRDVYASYLLRMKKYKEVQYLYLMIRIKEGIAANAIWTYARAFYNDSKLRYAEDILIYYFGINIFDKAVLKKIDDEYKDLNLDRVFRNLSYSAFLNRDYGKLKALALYTSVAETLLLFLNKKDNIMYYSNEEILSRENPFIYTVILYGEILKLLKGRARFDFDDTFDRLVKKISTLPFAFIFLEEVKRFISTHFYSFFARENIALINKYEKKLSITKEVCENLFIISEYFHPNYDFYTHTYQYSLAFEQEKVVCKIQDDGKKITTYCNYCEKPNESCNHFSKDLFNDLIINDPSKTKKINEFYLQLQDLKEKALKKEYEKRTFDELVQLIKKNDVLTPCELVHLTPYLFVASSFSDYDQRLSLKIGNKKKYIIKKLDEFIKNINLKNQVKYGKELNFIHDIKNFDEESRFIISNIQGIFNNSFQIYQNTREINVTKGFVDSLLKKYKNEIVITSVNEFERVCKVSEAKLAINIEVKDDLMKIKDIIIDMLIIGEEYDYALIDHTIYPIEADEELRPLIRFCYYNDEFNIKNVKSDFIKQIYSRFGDSLIIDDDLKQAVNDVDVKIETYFSMDNDIIKCESKFFLKNEEVPLSEIINNDYCSYKITKYVAIIENLGFVDGVIKDNDSSILFLSTNLKDLKKISDVYLSDNIKRIQIKRLQKPTPRVSYDNNMLSICLKDFNYSNEELYKILQAIKKKQRFVKLKDDVIIDIDEEAGNKLIDYTLEFPINEKKLSENQVIPHYFSMKLLNESESFKDYEFDELLKKIFYDISHYKESSFKVPDSLDNVMRSYQKEAFKWMKILTKYNLSGILADDMGLGKTLEIISLIMDSSIKMPSLIVCPKSLTFNWLAEFLKWDKTQEVEIISGATSYRNQILKDVKKNIKKIYITSYDTLKNDLEHYKSIKFEFIILDEAQYIKNHTTLKAQSVKQLNGNHKFVLTGTPIENSLVDLWSIFDFLMPNYLYSYAQFKNQFEIEIVQNKNKEVKANLIKKITPFILRRTKEDVLKDLPEKIESIQYVEMTQEIKKYYEAELLKLRDMLDDPKNKIQILSSFTRLRQLCVDPSLYIDDYHELSPKLELTINLINDYTNNNHKVIVFSQFTSVFPHLEKLLKKAGIAYFTLTGKTSSAERIEMANTFNDELSDEKVFLVSLKAGGTGLNLVGADIVIHLDPWWNVAAEAQATGRAHRIGQKNVVNVIKIVCLDSIEQKVIELQNIKKELISDIIADNDENIQKLTTEDLKMLLDTF